MTLSPGQLEALRNLARKQAGEEVDWISISDARSLTDLGFAERSQEGWDITPAGTAVLAAGGPSEAALSGPTPGEARAVTTNDHGADRVDQVLGTPDLVHALESDRFKQFLDLVPVAIAVSALTPHEHIVYANRDFEALSGQPGDQIVGNSWDLLPPAKSLTGGRELHKAIDQAQDYVGVFHLVRDGVERSVDVWSNIIEDDDGTPVYRLVALVETHLPERADAADLERLIEEKDTLLRELQHRVKNNLQMITSLIRIEARGLHDHVAGERFDRLAGRVEALALLYRSLNQEGSEDSIDLGVYLSEIASAVMRAHAIEGIHLNLQVDTWPVSVNVAMPAGLVVNELLTNALKHAFEGREGGTITLHCLSDDAGCRVTVADDGVGLPEGAEWPRAGKLSALIVQSLRQNAKADVAVESAPGKGMRVSIFFARADASAEAD